MITKDDKTIQTCAAEGLENMIVAIHGRGVRVTGSLCILRLQDGKVITVSGGDHQVPIRSTALAGLVGLLEIIESTCSHDSIAQQDVAGLRESVLDYVRRLDGLSEDAAFSMH